MMLASKVVRICRLFALLLITMFWPALAIGAALAAARGGVKSLEAWWFDVNSHVPGSLDINGPPVEVMWIRLGLLVLVSTAVVFWNKETLGTWRRRR
jgi:hypothetical protein